MWSAEQKKGLAIALVGHGVYGVSHYLLGAASPSAAVYAGGALASLLMIYGSALYIRGKGYSPLWGLGGFIPFVGLGTLLLIPAFPGVPGAHDGKSPARAPGET